MDHNELWKAALTEIELAIPRASFITWFKETAISDISNGVVTVAVPNGFAKEWLQNKYNKFVVRAVRNVGGDTLKEISYVIGKASDAEIAKNRERARRPKMQPQVPEEMQFKDLQTDPETGLNPRYTFDTFVVGTFNDLAHAASQAIVKNPGFSQYNPLFVFGGVGLGKTHLIQAIGNEVTRSRGLKVKYVTSEKYMGEIVDAIANQSMPQFKDRYSRTDVLIVDDIQFIGKTERMQEMFFHTFNALYNTNKQIIISSDRPPSAIPTLEKRLQSRFEGGVLADISEPDFETRLTILKTKAVQKNVFIDEETMRYVASTIKNNIRELEGALNRLALNASISSLPLTLDEAKRVLEQITQAPKRFTSPKKVVKAVADFYEIVERDLINPSRRKEIVRPRQVAMYILREELKCSFPFIGERLGKKDHTTAIHACKKIEEELKKSQDLQNEVRLIKEKIYSA